jgi:hypothetical protein
MVLEIATVVVEGKVCLNSANGCRDLLGHKLQVQVLGLKPIENKIQKVIVHICEHQNKPVDTCRHQK